MVNTKAKSTSVKQQYIDAKYTSVKKQFILNEDTIHFEKTKYIYDISQNQKTLISTVVTDSEDFPLNEVTPHILKLIRESGQPGFVLKKDGRLLCATGKRLRKYRNCVGCTKNRHTHKCNEKNMICRRLSALPDAKGGCAKVRDKDARIEDYDFITEGYEFFNVSQGPLIVSACSHWTPDYEAARRSKISQTDVYNRKLAIAQYIWPEVKSLNAVRKNLKNSRNVK